MARQELVPNTILAKMIVAAGVDVVLAQIQAIALMPHQLGA
ncbi:MAG TPA: hypothetical protein VNE67_14880 [Acetobacteraceae bacterium]|nr:hypothetical protein [Acetobacteraceae bacterium]